MKFWLVCKLHYLQFGFQKYRRSRSQMYFGIVLEIAFEMYFCAKYLRTLFLQNTSGGCFWKYLMNSPFIALENKWCHFMVRIGSQALISLNCVCFVSFNFFLFFSYFFVDSTTFGFEVSLSILKIKQWTCSQVPKWSFEG